MEQICGGAAIVFVLDAAGRDVLAIGPGRFDSSDPLASVFPATFNTTLGWVDDNSAEPYIFHDWSDATIGAVVAQALYDLSTREEGK